MVFVDEATRRKIIIMLGEKAKRVSEVAKVLNVKPTTARAYLRQLASEGFVQPIGVKWHLTARGKLLYDRIKKEEETRAWERYKEAKGKVAPCVEEVGTFYEPRTKEKGGVPGLVWDTVIENGQPIGIRVCFNPGRAVGEFSGWARLVKAVKRGGNAFSLIGPIIPFCKLGERAFVENGGVVVLVRREKEGRVAYVVRVEDGQPKVYLRVPWRYDYTSRVVATVEALLPSTSTGYIDIYNIIDRAFRRAFRETAGLWWNGPMPTELVMMVERVEKGEISLEDAIDRAIQLGVSLGRRKSVETFSELIPPSVPKRTVSLKTLVGKDVELEAFIRNASLTGHLSGEMELKQIKYVLDMARRAMEWARRELSRAPLHRLPPEERGRILGEFYYLAYRCSLSAHPSKCLQHVRETFIERINEMVRSLENVRGI